MGLFLPNLTATLKRLQELKDGGSMKTCLPLVDVLIDTLHQRFEAYFEDMDCIIAATIHPNFKLAWLHCLSIINRKQNTIRPNAVRKLTCLVKNFSEMNDQNVNNSNDQTRNSEDNIFDFSYIQEDKNLSASRLVKDFLDEPPRKQSTKSAFINNSFEDIFIKYNVAIPSSAAVEKVFF